MLYNDPLHIPSERLVVYYDGEPQFMLNKRLLDQQICWTNLEAIKEKHVERIHLHKTMEKETDPDLLKLYDELYTLIEYELQDLWRFNRDKLYHMIWKRPHCTCPVLDNHDAYPHLRYINKGCILHG